MVAGVARCGSERWGPAVVVLVDEVVDLGLEFGDGGGAGLAGEPFLEGLVEAFNFSAGGGVVGGGVDLCDAVAVQFGFKAVAPALAASESGSEDHAVIGQRGVWDAMLINGFGEFCDDYGAGDAAVGGHR